MSGRAATERFAFVPPGPAAAVAADREPLARLGLDLVLFLLLGAFAVAQWAHLFADPPIAELTGALAVATVGGLGIAALGRARSMPGRVTAIAVVGVGTVLAALVVAGLPARLLAPGNWDELGTNLDAGLSGVQRADLPYAGDDVWTRLTLLLGAPLLLGLAASLTFWPVARSVTRIGGLAALLAIYGVAVTLDAPHAELLWGVPLLILAVAWLWLPASGWRRGAGVLACGAVAAGLALPIAAVLNTERPWWNYESWSWFGIDEAITFDWNHKYGPLDWPQEGTTLLEVRSEQPLYWKTSVLDRFDGFTWQRADPGDPLAEPEVAARAAQSEALALARANPEWLLTASFDVRDLESDFIVGAGTPLRIEGHGAAPTGDGTVLAVDEPLEPGAEYTIRTYSPQPSPNRMRGAPESYPEGVVTGSTLVGLPAEVPTVGPSGFGSAAAIRVPAWGPPHDPRERVVADRTERLIARSTYGEVYALARSLTAEAPTAYDAVIAIERHLRENYDYTPNVPARTYPLHAFLFEDVAGYCQQFSGAMALMLRMVGIPARVVSGFAPGRYVAAEDLYEVSDTDAHSWVEVYFPSIGWVAFDPTPSAAPAAAQQLEAGGPVVLRRDGSAQQEALRGGLASEEVLRGGRAGQAEPADGGNPVGVVVGGALAVVGLWFGLGYVRRRTRLRGPGAPQLQARELTAALTRLGWRLPPNVTLHAIERQFATAGRSSIASYARALGRYRFEPGPARPPGPAERRDLRRALARGGLRRRWRTLRAVPPGGPGMRP